MESAQPLRPVPPPHFLRQPLSLQEEKVENHLLLQSHGPHTSFPGGPAFQPLKGTGAPSKEEGKSQLRINGSRTRVCILTHPKGPPQSSWSLLSSPLESLWEKWPAMGVQPFSSGPPGSSAGGAAHWRPVWVPRLGSGRSTSLTGGQGCVPLRRRGILLPLPSPESRRDRAASLLPSRLRRPEPAPAPVVAAAAAWAAGSAGYAPKWPGLPRWGRGRASGGEEGVRAEAKEVQRTGYTLREQGLAATAAPGHRTLDALNLQRPRARRGGKP